MKEYSLEERSEDSMILSVVQHVSNGSFDGSGLLCQRNEFPSLLSLKLLRYFF